MIDVASGPRYAALATRMARRLTDELGEGPQALPMDAWLAPGG